MPAHRLLIEVTNHGAARRRQPTGRTNGLLRFSRPIVVLGPCPGYTIVSSGSAYSFVRIDPASVSKSLPGKSVRPIEPLNSASPTIAAWASAQ